MERENFYILLELSINPPESDLKKIEAAITNKQSEWSRHRNHPTKGLQAQQFISMIPEIRRVMKDPALRKQEAASAMDLAVKEKAGKIVEIDRHIDILIGKGFISKEEIVKLAQLHDISENEIQGRIRIKKDERFSKVDQQLSLRMAKGYITEEEINKLAKRHNLKPEEVKSRVYIPMLKNGKTENISPPRQLDKSLEKSIKENLKIVDKSSLYVFLDIHETSELEALQSAASEKKKQLANLGKKDARVTAGNILAGHCVTIFKNEESRIAYDISLAKSKLAELDSDIDISGYNGKVRRVYYDILIQKAMDFGMESQEAERYINDYCKRKNWSIEQSKDKKTKFIIIGAILGIILLAASTTSLLYIKFNHTQRLQEEYAAISEQAGAMTDPLDAAALLRQYINQHQGEKGYSEHIDKALARKQAYLLKAAEKKYSGIKKQLDDLIDHTDFEAAIAHIDKYLTTQPPEPYSLKADKERSRINAMIEKNSFDALTGILIEASANEKIVALTNYIEKYPNGNSINEVKSMLSEMSHEYYIYVNNSLQKAEAAQDWQECAKLAQRYIDLYDNSHADKLKTQLDRYRENIHQQRILNTLRQKAAGFGDDYQQALRVYSDYLAAYRNTPIKDEINIEVHRLKELSLKAEKRLSRKQLIDLLNNTNGRFVLNPMDTVTDTKTGLMWMLFDSNASSVQECMTFDEAITYAENISAGGYSDWRIPTAAELTAIYGEKPYFPTIVEKWYWSADSFSGYSEGWYRRVNTITVSPDGEALESRRDTRECGAVRAVRN